MASRQTKVIGGSGTQSQSFVLDPGLFQYVQSVLVEVDNTAGPDVNPTLTVGTVNGQPIADKTQGTAIPAGDTGRATWALRLTDETPSGGGTVGGPHATYFGVLNPIPAIGGFFSWIFDAGTALLDLTTPTAPAFLAAGTYAFAANVSFNGPGVANTTASSVMALTTAGFPGLSVGDVRWYMTGTGGGTACGCALTEVWQVAAGDLLQVNVRLNPSPGARSASLNAQIQQLG